MKRIKTIGVHTLNHEFHIVYVQETNLRGDNQRTPKIKGYSSIRTDRPSL